MLQKVINYFSIRQAAGLSALVALQVPVPAMPVSGLPPVATASQPSPSPAAASYRCNPCLFVRQHFLISEFGIGNS
jgi:hypothetical protein